MRERGPPSSSTWLKLKISVMNTAPRSIIKIIITITRTITTLLARIKAKCLVKSEVASVKGTAMLLITISSSSINNSSRIMEVSGERTQTVSLRRPSAAVAAKIRIASEVSTASAATVARAAKSSHSSRSISRLLQLIRVAGPNRQARTTAQRQEMLPLGEASRKLACAEQCWSTKLWVHSSNVRRCKVETTKVTLQLHCTAHLSVAFTEALLSPLIY